MTDLQALVRPFPTRYVHDKPGARGGSYVKAGTTIQRLLHVVGPYDWHLVELLRGDYHWVDKERVHHSLENVIVGAIWRLTVQVDGREVSVCGTGDVEHPNDKPSDGARAKDAESDALKRAAKHLGVALHLWSGDEFYLELALAQKNGNEEGGDAGDRSTS